MKRLKFWALIIVLTALAGAYAHWIEPHWLAVRTLSLNGQPTHTFVLFSDLHYKSDLAFANKVLSQIKERQPAFVCFTGDLIDDIQFQDSALEWIRQFPCPVYGVPGNHEYRSDSSEEKYQQAFAATGGAWLTDKAATLPDQSAAVVGVTGTIDGLPEIPDAPIKLLLTHHPDFVERVGGITFDLVMAGHSHGGQVRIPFLGAPIVPAGVKQYKRGRFDTPIGPLYVTTGLGMWFLPFRFFCRPEIVAITY